MEEGLPQFKNYFLQGNTKNMMKEVLDPEEFDNFYNLIEVMNKAFSIQKTGSATQPLLAIKEKLTQDAKSLPVKTTSLILSAINLPGRIVQGRFGEDVVKKISMNQAEAYYQALTDALFDPQATKISETAYDSISELQSEIQDIYDDLDTLLNVAAPEQIQIPDEEEVTDTIKKTIEILTNLQTVDI